MHTIIRAALLPQIANFQSQDPSRYYLQGALIEPCASGTGARLVATNGSVLAIIRAEDGRTNKANIWPLSKELLAACAHKPRDGYARWAVVSGEAGKPNIIVIVPAKDADQAAETAKSPAAIEYTAFITAIDGTFPDYLRVLPTKGENTELANNAYNPDLIAKFGAVAKFDAQGEKRKHPSPIRIFSSSDRLPTNQKLGENPATVKITGRPDFFGVLMPMRADDTVDDARPDWLASKAPEHVPAEDQAA
jgi:hypothetical protein